MCIRLGRTEYASSVSGGPRYWPAKLQPPYGAGLPFPPTSTAESVVGMPASCIKEWITHLYPLMQADCAALPHATFCLAFELARPQYATVCVARTLPHIIIGVLSRKVFHPKRNEEHCILIPISSLVYL